MTHPHYRRCWDCGAINLHADNVAPEVCCKRCRSMDTRAFKDLPPLWNPVGNGVCVPRRVAKCPECGGELMAESHINEIETGRPLSSGIDLSCRNDADEPFEKLHRWQQSTWQPVRDAVVKWCDARVD